MTKQWGYKGCDCLLQSTTSLSYHVGGAETSVLVTEAYVNSRHLEWLRLPPSLTVEEMIKKVEDDIDVRLAKGQIIPQ